MYIAIYLKTIINLKFAIMFFKVTYTKEFNANVSDAVFIAKLIQPKDTTLENVEEIKNEIHPLFDQILENCKIKPIIKHGK